jgi:hypothetical protein
MNDPITEHEPRAEEKKTEVYSPTTEERQAIKLVENLFQKAKSARGRYDQRWLDYYKFFRGVQWKEQRPSYRHSEVINFVFQTIQSVVPILVDARPRIQFLPTDPTDNDYAQLMNDICESDWISKNWLEALTEVVYDGHFYGTGMSNLTYDGDANHGAGDIIFESEDVFNAFPDPEARDVNKNSTYFICARPRPIEWIKKKWPDHKDHVKPDLIDLMKGAKTALNKVTFRSPVDDKMYLEQEGTPADSLDKDKAMVVTLYVKDDSFDEEEKEDEAGEKVYEQRKKYPNGRKIVVCSGVLLEDGPNPYDDGEFPYQRWQNYMLPREFWGISEVEQLESPQKIFNKLVSFSLDVLTLMGNPIWIVSNDSDVDVENLFNRPGLIIEKNPGSEVRREEGVQLQPYVLQLVDRMQQWFNDIAGTQDVSRGATPGSVSAASAISALQEAALTRVRQKSRNLDMYLQSLGQQYASRVMQFYTAPRVFRLTNNEGATRYFKASFQEGKAYVQQWNGTGYEMPMELEARGKLDVRVTTGSSLPFARAEKEQKLLSLFDRGIIDAQEVMKGMDFPNWEAILNRVQEKQAQAAAAQQAAGG